MRKLRGHRKGNIVLRFSVRQSRLPQDAGSGKSRTRIGCLNHHRLDRLRKALELLQPVGVMYALGGYTV